MALVLVVKWASYFLTSTKVKRFIWRCRFIKQPSEQHEYLHHQSLWQGYGKVISRNLHSLTVCFSVDG